MNSLVHDLFVILLLCDIDLGVCCFCLYVIDLGVRSEVTWGADFFLFDSLNLKGAGS